jgi:hypothetical protein
VQHILLIVSAAPCSTAVERRSIHDSRLTDEQVEAGMKPRQAGRKPRRNQGITHWLPLEWVSRIGGKRECKP